MKSGGKTRDIKEDGVFGKYLKPVAISCFVGTLVSLGFLLLFSFLLSIRDIPLMLINPLAVFSVAAGSFAAGFCCSKLVRKRGMWWGCICGVILFCLMLLTSLTFAGDGLGLMALTKLAIIVACSMIGGIIGVNSRKKPR